jgi:hypothetical protein
MDTDYTDEKRNGMDADDADERESNSVGVRVRAESA